MCGLCVTSRVRGQQRIQDEAETGRVLGVSRASFQALAAEVTRCLLEKRCKAVRRADTQARGPRGVRSRQRRLDAKFPQALKSPGGQQDLADFSAWSQGHPSLLCSRTRPSVVPGALEAQGR